LLRIRKLVRNRVIDFGIEKEKYGLFWQKEEENGWFGDGLTGESNTYSCFKMVLAE
jgi:hypothetical protein